MSVVAERRPSVHESIDIGASPERSKIREVKIIQQPDLPRPHLIDPHYQELKEHEPLPKWRNEVVYQIMTKSFFDSDGDGKGDLKGIIKKAEYIREMGYDAIWLNPIHKSPHKDNGYDLASYYAVDRQYGTNKDLENVIKTMKENGVGVYLDLVINHTSDRHPWFIKSSESKDSPVRDVYVWKEGTKDKDEKPMPANNWLSIFGGPAWTFSEKTGQFYLHKFLKEQPDLNLRNPEVRKHILTMLIPRLLRLGVSGFRMDAVDLYFEDSAYKDADLNPDYKTGDMEVQKLKMDERFKVPDETNNFVHEIMDVLDQYGAVGIGEVSPKNVSLFQDIYMKGRMHAPFNFRLMHIVNQYGADAAKLKVSWDAYMQMLPEGACASSVFDNHDQNSRLVDKAGENMRPLLLMQMTLGGEGGCMKFVHYGDEFAMPSGNITPDTMDDPQGKTEGIKKSRDFSRTPMAWTNTENGGFSVNPDAKPWLPLGDTSHGNNVEAQRKDPGSMLNLTKNAIKFVKEQSALLCGKYVPYETGEPATYVFGRETNGQKCLTLLNFSGENKVMLLPDGKTSGEMIFSTDHKRILGSVENSIILEPHSGCVIELK